MILQNLILHPYYQKEKKSVSVNYESADLIYHLLVLLKKFDIDPEQVYEELEKREGKTGLRN